MPVPVEILAVKRPKNTRVKKSGDRWLVIKRTCRRVGKRNLPVDLGTIGEIIDGHYVEIRSQPRRRTADVKDYGRVKLCRDCAGDMLQDLARVWDIKDAKRLYVLALLRAAYGDVRDRDLALQYDTSFLSEWVPGVALSANTVSAFLESVGRGLSAITEYMNSRLASHQGQPVIIDGMLKDYNSRCSTMSEFSRKGATKHSRDVSIMYAYSPQLGEPLAARPYPGNMLDSTAVEDFLTDMHVSHGMMVMDKGFHNDRVFEAVDRREGLSYLVPLKRNSAIITRYGMDNPVEHLDGYKDAVVLYKKTRMANGKWLYAYRDPSLACEQENAYVVSSAKKDRYDSARYAQLRPRFGLVVFQSKSDLDPLDIYRAYKGRWEIETLFGMYKNIIESATVGVHDDYRLYATELVNFLSAVIACRVKKAVHSDPVASKYSLKQVRLYLSKVKKVRLGDSDKWRDATTVAYIADLAKSLRIVD